jgi:hypothetical protein
MIIKTNDLKIYTRVYDLKTYYYIYAGYIHIKF